MLADLLRATRLSGSPSRCRGFASPSRLPKVGIFTIHQNHAKSRTARALWRQMAFSARPESTSLLPIARRSLPPSRPILFARPSPSLWFNRPSPPRARPGTSDRTVLGSESHNAKKACGPPAPGLACRLTRKHPGMARSSGPQAGHWKAEAWRLEALKMKKAQRLTVGQTPGLVGVVVSRCGSVAAWVPAVPRRSSPPAHVLFRTIVYTVSDARRLRRLSPSRRRADFFFTRRAAESPVAARKGRTTALIHRTSRHPNRRQLWNRKR